jgi:hypothetical protein
MTGEAVGGNPSPLPSTPVERTVTVAKKKKEKATELEFLQWFYVNVDFGPAHGDVIYTLKESFKDETGKDLPDGYNEEE